MEEKRVSIQTLRRLPVYLHYLKTIKKKQVTISATGIADAFGLNDVQVRKDLGSVCAGGKPKTGYGVEELIDQMEAYLGCRAITQTVLIGAGSLGKALLLYDGFKDYGLSILFAFDQSKDVIGSSINGKPVLPMEDLESICVERKIRLAILTLPASDAQRVCDRLVACGISAIWNFAPVILKTPDRVAVENGNFASSLAVLSQYLRS